MSSRSRFVVVLFVVAVSVFSGGWLLGRGMQGGETPYARERLFNDVFEHVQRLYVDSLAPTDLYEKAMSGMLDELGDPHTLYLKPDRLRRLNESTTGNYTGLGLQVDVRDGWPTVLAPLPGGPAERAGLKSGDRIIEVASKSTKGLTTDEMRLLLRGPVGTELSIVVERPGVSDRLPLVVTRGEIHRRAVRRSALLQSGVGYVDVKVFSDSTEVELSRAIDSLSKAGMQSLVLDLRANPGGLLSQGVGVSDLFLEPNEDIVRIKGRIPEANKTFADTAAQTWPKLPLVVLIDEGSASAAEIVAGALQDHDRAVIIGRTSYGKGSAQSLYTTNSGGALKLTTARWYTPSGRSIDRTHTAHDDAVAEPRKGENRPRFKTDHGRVVLGGGGITPDVMAGDTALSPQELALQTALGGKIPQFRDALTAFAITQKTSGAIRSPEFVVTPQMLDAFWSTLRARGVLLDKGVYDAASPLVSRLVGREIARFVFGAAAEARRSIDEDEVIQVAVRLAAGAKSPDELLKRAASANATTLARH